MFTENEKPEETPEETTEETPEAPETPEGGEEKPQKPEGEEGTADQSAEIDRLKGELAKKDISFKKLEREVTQQRYVIGKKDKLLQKAKEEGFVTEEEGQGLSKEELAEMLDERLNPIKEENKTLKQQLAEIAKASQAKPNPVPSGPGQKLPAKPKEPELPPNLQGKGLKWTGKGRIFKSEKTGRIYDLDAPADEQ